MTGVVTEDPQQVVSEMNETAYVRESDSASSAIPDEDDDSVRDSSTDMKERALRRTKSASSVPSDIPVMMTGFTLPSGPPFPVAGQFPATSFFPNFVYGTTPQELMAVMQAGVAGISPEIAAQLLGMGGQQFLRMPRRGRGGRMSETRDR